MAKKTPQVKSFTVSLLTGSDTACVAKWKWSKTHTDHFEFVWEYYNTKKNGWVQGGTSNVGTAKTGGYFQHTFNAPSDLSATKVRASVKPVAQKTKNEKYKDSKGKTQTRQVLWWTAGKRTCTAIALPGTVPAPNSPGKPTVTLVGDTITVTFDYTDDKANQLIVEKATDTQTYAAAVTLNKTTNGRYSWQDKNASRGHTYYYRVYAKNSTSGKTSQRGPYETIEHKPANMTALAASLSSLNTQDGNGAVKLSWKDSGKLRGTIEVEYAPYDVWATSSTDKSKQTFTANPDSKGVTSVIVTGLERGKTWYFRVRRKNANNLYSEYAKTSAGAYTVSISVVAPATAVFALGRPNVSAVTDMTRVTSERGSVKFEWEGGPWTTGHRCEVQYTELAENYAGNAIDSISTATLEYEDSSNTRVITVSNLDRGKTWYFRLRIVTDDDISNWATIATGAWRESESIARVTLSPAPQVTGTETLNAPTCSTTPTSCVIGDSVMLAWTHNSEQGSTQTAYELQISEQEPGGAATVRTVTGGETTAYELDTSGYGDGTTVTWRVRTVGVDPEVLSPWSRTQMMRAWCAPVATATISELVEAVLSSFPFTVTADASGTSDENAPIMWWAEIAAAVAYDGIGADGADMTVAAGDVLWRHESNASQDGFDASTLSVEVGANEVALMAGETYSLRVGCYTSQGLRGEAAPVTFGVEWSGAVPDPSMTLEFDRQDYCCYAFPVCETVTEVDDGEGNISEVTSLTENVTLAVWRIEDDDTTTLVADGIANDGESYVIDPHPSGGTQWYRVVARSTTSGLQSSIDQPVECTIPFFVIQWDERWTVPQDDGGEVDVQAETRYTGNVLELPYNIQVDERHEPDVALREYLGRRWPVSAYGTQLGESATWKCDVRKDDAETMALIRRLMAWRGDCYVRDPTGNGYWANIGDVRVSHSYDTFATSVSFDVTRVEAPSGTEAVNVP